MESLIDSLTCSLELHHQNGTSTTSASGVGNYNNNNLLGGGGSGSGSGNSGGGLMMASGKHFLENPKYLPCCRRKACNLCILKCLVRRRHSAATTMMNHHSAAASEMMFTCGLCGKTSRVTVTCSPNGHQEVNLDSDEMARDEYERNLTEINHYLIKKLEAAVKHVEDRLQHKEKYLNKRREFIEDEIHAQVEALKTHLDVLEDEMRASLIRSTENMVHMLAKFEKANVPRLDDMKIAIENLRTNAVMMNGSGNLVQRDGSGAETMTSNKHHHMLSPNLNLALQHQSVNQCVESLSELSNMSKSISEMISEMRFEPIVDLPPASVILGNLKEVNEPNLKELFKTVKSHSQIARLPTLLPTSPQPMPISPRYMCIADPYTMLFTDSQTKQLVQIKLDSGELMRASNLAGQLKNPDGVCVNPVAGCIYVSDSELKLIFKLDYQFNILKKFGYKDLKWPRGIFYDYESSYPANGGSSSINPNRLYVCDPSSQFIAIYNDHEQLRDCLTISMSDEPLPSYSKANEMMEVKSALNGNGSGQTVIEEELKFCPLNVFVTKTLIYVTDDWTGGNCIRIFDKHSHRLMRNVGDLNAWNPLGLVVDDIGNIFSVARLYYETGATHLFCFSKDGDLLYKTNLNISNECVTDILLDKFTSRINNRIICSGDKKIHFFQFS